jgi:hypothetical protein
MRHSGSSFRKRGEQLMRSCEQPMRGFRLKRQEPDLDVEPADGTGRCRLI